MVASKSRWIGVCAAAAVAMVTCAGTLAQTPAPSDGRAASPIFDITPEQLSRLLNEAGYTIRARDAELWTVDTPTDQVLFLQLLGCGAGRCPAIRIRGIWELGDREVAIGAARLYEETEYLANVSVQRKAEETVLFVGRDVWLSSGRTPQNLLSQVDQVDEATAAVTNLLLEKDPGIVDYWRELREANDE